MSGRNTGASVRARLLNKAKAENRDYNLLLTRYALERLLYRLGKSPYAERFLLKGALLFDLWFDMPNRPTRDADLLGFGSSDIPRLEAVFREICVIACDDGMMFDATGVRAEEIRKEARYAGIRVTLMGHLDGARCPTQVDVGFGDVVTPGAEPADYPVLLPEFPRPHLLTYPKYSVVAEKTEAIVSLGFANTRLKDYFDLLVLARHAELDKDTLAEAVRATFARRGTALPAETPDGLSEEFGNDTGKRTQWNAFLKKNRLDAPSLPDALAELRAFLSPLLGIK